MRIAEKRFYIGRVPLLPLFAVGVLAGILIMNIGESILLENTGLLDEEILCHIKYATIDRNALFCYVTRKRLVAVLLLAVLFTTYLGEVICIGTVFWYGMSFGTLFAALVLRYGIKGILLCVTVLFPQYFLYIPAILGLLLWGDSVYRSIYLRDRAEAENTFLAKKMGQLAGILFLILAGCALEGFFHPVLLIKLLKVF